MNKIMDRESETRLIQVLFRDHYQYDGPRFFVLFRCAVVEKSLNDMLYLG